MQDCLYDMNQALAENIFENHEHVCQLPFDAPMPKVQRWHSSVNRDNRELGGYYWSTYKAIMKREGVYSNAQGPPGSYCLSHATLAHSVSAAVFFYSFPCLVDETAYSQSIEESFALTTRICPRS